MNNIKFFIIILIFLGCLSFSLFMEIPLFENLHQKVEKYNSQFPQIKVFLHLDKDQYMVNENIWFKAYIADLQNHTPDTSNRLLYVELISPKKAIYQTKLLKITNGLANGDMLLCDTFPQGLYQIRAYTNWMLNFDKGFLFTQNIYISNPYEEFLRKDYKLAKKHNKKTDKTASKYEFNFFPEGGYMVYNLENNVAVKAINLLGNSIEFEGKIIDKKTDNEIVKFKSENQGLGKFIFSPIKSTDYQAIIRFSDGKEEKYEMPEILDFGYIMKITNTSKTKATLTIETNNPDIKPELPEKQLFIAGMVRNKVYFTHQTQLKNNKTEIIIDKNKFPGGIIQLTLFDYNGKPLCERLLFNPPSETFNIQVIKSSDNQHVNDSAYFTLNTINNKNNDAVAANISMSGTYITNVNTLPFNSIINYYFLESEIPGRIENPQNYADLNSPEVLQNIDLLMLTNGWRRFKWDEILNQNYPEKKYPVEKQIDITGKITKYFFEIPSPFSTVKLTILNAYNDTRELTTNKKGRFRFPNIDYNDTVDVLIEARTRWGRKNILILVDESTQPKPLYLPITKFTDEKLAIMKKSKRFEKLPPEVEADDGRHRLHSEADNVIKLTAQDGSYSSPLEVLRGRVAGVQITGAGSSTRALIRGMSSLYSSNDPLYLIDGIPASVDAVNSMSTNDIEKIEVIKNPGQLGVYGMQGGNGVIAIYTKRGFYMKRGELRFKMIGYCTPREFYQPKYINYDDRFENPTLTWKPNVSTNKEGKAPITFKNPDKPGKVRLTVQGITTNGLVGYQVLDYEVNNK